MGILWDSISVICICTCLFVVTFSVYKVILEKKQIQIPISKEEMLPWYSNASICKYSELSVDAILLALFAANLKSFINHFPSSVLWEAGILFLYSCSRFTFTLIKEIGYRKSAEASDEILSSWWYSSSFHQGIAVAIFWLGVSLVT